MAQWVAYHLCEMTGHTVLAVYAEEDTAQGERRRVFRRGYDRLVAQKNVLVVEDVLTTGGSARSVIQAVQEHDGIPVGLGALCNRGQITAASLGVGKLYALVTMTLESWDASECPLCQQGVPINTQVGKGKSFLQKTGG
jgi:orotate phosphoribosyltransferase